jgi:glyoxylase-like metal-dependent hydrolase (beta-lactamase superfamily II)
MSKPFKVAEGVYQVGGPDMTSPEDCCIYLVDLGRPILIDAGCGKDPRKLVRNLESLQYSPKDISLIVLTHCHIDHVGGVPYLAEKYGLPVAIHDLDAQAVEEGDSRKTAASWYGVSLEPISIKFRLSGEEGVLEGGTSPLRWLHTPGHTPGSISLLIDNGLYRILFGQDIHGPFYNSFGSNLDDWEASMRRLLEESADILCEGHFGIIQPASEVRRYIEDYLRNYGRL